METQNDNTLELLDSYEAPEVAELGKAALLTLGSTGCSDDVGDCKITFDPVFDF